MAIQEKAYCIICVTQRVIDKIFIYYECNRSILLLRMAEGNENPEGLYLVSYKFLFVG